MNYLKYLTYQYTSNKNNCWEFVRFVYENEHNIKLPKLPILDTQQKECELYLKANIKHRRVEKAKKGSLIHYTSGNREHIGYAVDNKKYMHLKSVGVLIQDIPKTALIYEVVND